MRNFIDSLKARRDAAKNEGGFSLIDVVVTVAIIVALSVGGFVAYTGIVDNAKQAATASAADQVYTAVTVKNVDGAPDMDPIKDYNDSSDAIKVYTDGTEVLAVHRDAFVANTAPADFTAAKALDTAPNSNEDLVASRG